jgi:uridylate kinase
MYKRVLIKFSGEQLAGKHDFGIDPDVARFLRGAEVAGNGIRRVTADQMGMLSGLMNAMALTDIFEENGVPTRCLSMIFAEQVAESYSYRLAEKHLANGRVVIVAGGTARPYVTHDTAAVSFGLELDCEVVLKATKVDGVYDKDPAKYDDAQQLPFMSFQEAVENQEVKVMDKAALGLAMEQNKPIIVFNPFTSGNIINVVAGNQIGTKIS